jgi:N-acetyl-anhydromuramoyl-L-alanine amidase
VPFIGALSHAIWHDRPQAQPIPASAAPNVPERSRELVVDLPTGLLRGVRQVLSPHWDSRPAGQAPELLVLHGISLPPGEFGGPWIARLFCGNLPPGAHPYFEAIAAARVSAHVLVRRDGTIEQFVPFHGRAWHAGASSWGGRSACNDFSIGIELEGTDESPYEAPQYASLAALLGALLAAYPTLHGDRVVGHSDIAPGRKTDPGLSFDWAWLRAAVARLANNNNDGGRDQ